jgi:hypothetical protein
MEDSNPVPLDKNSIEYRVTKYARMIRSKIADPRWVETMRVRGMPEGFHSTPPNKIGFARHADGKIAVSATWRTPLSFKGACMAYVWDANQGYTYNRTADRRHDDAIVRLVAKELGAGFVSIYYSDPV